MVYHKLFLNRPTIKQGGVGMNGITRVFFPLLLGGILLSLVPGGATAFERAGCTPLLVEGSGVRMLSQTIAISPGWRADLPASS